MVNDNYLKEVFPQPPLTAYRSNKNISHLIRAKVPTAHRDRRILKGMKECGDPCIKEGKKIKISHVDWNLNSFRTHKRQVQ